VRFGDLLTLTLLRSVSVNLAEIGPLRPTPAHLQMSLRDGIDVRLRGGIQRASGAGGGAGVFDCSCKLR